MIFLDKSGNMNHVLKRVIIIFMLGQETESERQDEWISSPPVF